MDEALAFRVVFEVGFEHVLDVVGVGGDDAVEVDWAGEDGSVGGAVTEDLGGPFEEAVAVFKELR